MSEGFKIIEPNSEIDIILCANGTQWNKHCLEIGEEKFVIPERYFELANEVENLEIRDSDIFVVTHPRSGTTWAQEMIWMIYNLDYEKGKTPLALRFPYLESSCVFDFQYIKQMFPNFNIASNNSVSFIADMKENPRFIKTHLSWSLLPNDIREKKKRPKIIYIYRNPKDAFVSYYHFVSIRGFENTSFEDFSKIFIAGRAPYGPYWTHVFGFWERRNDPNMLFIRYEEMKKDLRSVILRVSKFLDKELAEEDINKLINHLSFENMKHNESMAEKGLKRDEEKVDQNKEFFRKGIVGSHKSEMTKEMIKIFDEWIYKNIKDTDFNID